MTSSRYNTGLENDLLQQMRDIKQRLDRLEAGNRITNTSIDSGKLVVGSGSFRVGSPDYHVYFGNVTNGPWTTPGWIFRRANLVNVFTLENQDADTQFWTLRDAQENILFGDDAGAEQGIARPYIPITFAPHFSNTGVYYTTTSGTFTGVVYCKFKKHQPRIFIQCYVRCSDGTTAGEIQVFDNNAAVPLADPVVIAAGTFAVVDLGPYYISGNFLDTMDVEIQLRRTAGVGTVGLLVINAHGQQS